MPKDKEAVCTEKRGNSKATELHTRPGRHPHVRTAERVYRTRNRGRYSTCETFLENHCVASETRMETALILFSSSSLFLPSLLFSLEIFVSSLPSFPVSFLRQLGTDRRDSRARTKKEIRLARRR